MEIFGNFKKVKRVETRRRTRRFDFWNPLRRDEFARHGCRTRWGPDEEASIKILFLSLCRNLELKSNKKVSYLNKKVVTCFRISRFLSSEFSIWTLYIYIYVTNIRCPFHPFRTWPYLALIVNMVHIHMPLKSIDQSKIFLKNLSIMFLIECDRSIESLLIFFFPLSIKQEIFVRYIKACMTGSWQWLTENCANNDFSQTNKW